MKLLSVSYPKKEDDIEKIKKFVTEYKENYEPKIKLEKYETQFKELTEVVKIH